MRICSKLDFPDTSNLSFHGVQIYCKSVFGYRTLQVPHYFLLALVFDCGLFCNLLSLASIPTYSHPKLLREARVDVKQGFTS